MKPMVTVEDERGIGGLADPLRLSPYPEARLLGRSRNVTARRHDAAGSG